MLTFAAATCHQLECDRRMTEECDFCGKKMGCGSQGGVGRYLLTCTCVGIHPGRVEPASPVELTASRTEALQARRSCPSSIETFTQHFLLRAWLTTCGPERGSRPALIVVVHVFRWPPCVGKRGSLISSPPGRLSA